MAKAKVRLTVNAYGDVILTPVSKRVSKRIARYNDNGYSVIFAQDGSEMSYPNFWKPYLSKNAFYQGRFNHNAIVMISDEMLDTWANCEDSRFK